MRIQAGGWFARTFHAHGQRQPALPRRLIWLRDGKNQLLYPTGPWEGCYLTNDTPVNAVKMLFVSIATQDTAALARVLAADYRFTAAGGALGPRFPNGLDRLAQMDSMTRLPPAQNLAILCEFPDSVSAHAAAPAQTRARVECVGRRWLLTDDEQVFNRDRTPCALVVTRGDAARLTAGQVADRGRWYVTAWHMGAATDSGALANPPGIDAPGSPPLTLRARRLSPLGEWPVTFELTLPFPTPAYIQVFDLAGRQVFERRLAAGSPGIRPFEFEAGNVSQGMYWLQINQNGREAVERFVILR
jgi:hypothetical protein